jgi:hypothetical protein
MAHGRALAHSLSVPERARIPCVVAQVVWRHIVQILRTLTVLCAGLLVVGCSDIASPTQPTALQGGAPVNIRTATADNTARLLSGATPHMPFKGGLSGAWTVDFDPPPSPFFTVVFDGTGNGTQLGRFVFHTVHRVNTADGTAAGSYELTSASGDTLTGDFTGASGPTETPNVFAIVETVTITGGTGRFAGASGTFVIERLVDFNTSTSTGTFDGVLSLAVGKQ